MIRKGIFVNYLSNIYQHYISFHMVTKAFFNKHGPTPYSIGKVVHPKHYRGIHHEYLRVWQFLLYFCLINFGKTSGLFGKHVEGEMAWLPPDIHKWKSVISHWTRLCNMPTSRLNKRIALWADSNVTRSYKSWYFVVKDNLLSYNINTYNELNINVSKYSIIKELCDKMMSLYTNR